MGESEAETTPSDNSVKEEEEEEEEGGGGGGNDSAISEYEKQRLERIEENRARLKALGLPHLASSFLASPDTPPSKSKKKKKNISINNRNRRRKGTEDEEYRPSPDEEEESRGERENPFSSSEEEEVDVGNSSSRRRRKGKKSTSQAAKARKKLHGKETARGSEEIDDDAALQQAIALSLGGATEQMGSLEASQNCGTNGASSNSHAKKDSLNINQTAGRKNSRQMNKSRPQLTEDEVVALFFYFDVAGNGHITMRDLHRMVITHDFSWTDVEMESMIHCFDGDRDGMLSVEDFRSIISSLNMLQESRKC